MERIEQHQQVYEEIKAVFAKKNNDYGDDFFTGGHNSTDEFLNIKRKFARLKAMYEGVERKVEDETIEDTFIDLANYAIMAIMKRRLKAKTEEDEKDVSA